MGLVILFRSTKEILSAVKKGSLSVAKAEKLLKIDALEIVGAIARLDVHRGLRRGVPEVVYSQGKSRNQLVSIVERLLESGLSDGGYFTPIILSKIKPEQISGIRKLISNSKRFRSFKLTNHSLAKIAMIKIARTRFESNRGRVALLAAGTSDIPALTEAEVVLDGMNCETLRYNDVGVASLARLKKPLQDIQKFDPDALIVAAGMEGALPSVIAGLSGVPVIGLPTSVGYGYGGRGEAALMSMLQACPLGICVVNIDGGVAAGVVAALIANRCAELRGNSRDSR